MVDRRGEPQAVVTSVEEYLRNFVKKPAPLEAIQREAKAKRLDQLSLREINLETRRYRKERRHVGR
jgi:hypothetical protein